MSAQTTGSATAYHHHHQTAELLPMPNVAAVLKEEISRIARREIRAGLASLSKASASYRSQIAQLKKRVRELERDRRSRAKSAVGSNEDETAAPRPAQRFSPRGLAAQRRRLDLSAAECGLLVGASGQSIYNWQQGKTRPLARHLAAISALRTLTRKQARSIIESRSPRAGDKLDA